MTTPFSFFDKIYCINLDSRTDRWQAASERFKQLGIKVERYSAVSGDDKFKAFNQSQAGVIKRGLDDGCRRFLVLEDDVVFSNTGWLSISLKQLPYNWDALYLGGNVIGDDTKRWPRPTKISTHLCRLFNAWQTQSVAYSAKGARFVVDKFDPDGIIFDEWLRLNMMPEKLVYITNPQMTYQLPGYSDIWQRDTDYTSLLTRGNNIMGA